MTMRGFQAPIPATDYALETWFALLDFMRTASPGGAGWTISHSSDGTTGGAGDNIVDIGDLDTSTSYFVLRSPAGWEVLVYRTTANNTQWAARISASGSFSGGTAVAVPTAPDQMQWIDTDVVFASGTNVIQCGADDAAPYGWWLYLHASGNFSDPQGGMAMWPITDAVQPGDTDPCVMYYDGGTPGAGFTQILIESESTLTTVGRCSGVTPGTTSWDAIPGMGLKVGGATVYPNGGAQNNDGDLTSAPVTFERRAALAAPQRPKGISTFVQWNGQPAAPMTVYNAGARVSLGDVNVPHSGYTPSTTGV